MTTGATARVQSQRNVGGNAGGTEQPVRHSAAPARRAREVATFVSLTFVHALALVAVPSIPLIALGLWWNANTIAHNFIHRPFFRRTAANRAFSGWLTILLGIPQELWRARHLQHHAEAAGGAGRSTPITASLVFESTLVIALWASLAILVPHAFLWVYLPGWACGLALCQLQGYYEHARGTTSHYGRVYNLLFFNDGYHVEHHRRPAVAWHELPSLAGPATAGSRWPAVLRFLDRSSERVRPGVLEVLERLVLRSPRLQRFVLDRHQRAFRALLPSLGPIARVTVVGGGLFPRTPLILRRLLPHAALTVIDASPTNLERARPFLDAGVTLIQGVYDPASAMDADLVVVPLAYRGDRQRIYREPPAARVIVHDWIWSPRGTSTRVSWLLLKRLNLIRR